jgi:hypothetical protein
MATGDILAVRVIGSVTGVADAESACNTAGAGTGWVAEIDVEGLSTGGTYALGIGANNDPTNAKIVLTVTSSGYNSSGVLGTTTRTVYGTHQLRNVYNASYTAPYPSDETLVSSTLTLRIALSDALYSGDTATCDVDAGIYTQGGTPTNAATGVTVTNNSTLTYSQARVIANWSWPGWTRITGTTLTVRAVGFHRHAKDGKPLACMKFTASDQSGHTATVTVTDMTIDAGMADAGGKVQEYIGTLDLAGNSFTQGDKVTVNFAAYPWVGDSTSVMDTSDGVNTMPTPLYAPQYYIYDAAGTYGAPVAVVDPSNPSGTPTVVAESAFNGVNDAATLNPYATIKAAAVAIRAFNAANYAHADVNGTIYMKAGNYTYTGATTSVTASSGTNYDSDWVTITPFPGVARSAVIIDATTTSGNRAGAATVMQKLSGVTVAFTAGTPSISGGKYIWFHNCSLKSTVGAGMVSGTSGGVAYYTHNTVEAGGLVAGFSVVSSSVYPALTRGNDASQMLSAVNYFNAIGNLRSFPDSGVTSGAWQSHSGGAPVTSASAPIFAFNKFTNSKVGGGSTVLIGTTADNIIGAAFVGNLIELNTSGASASVDLSGYSTGTTNNLMAWHNTIVGQRVFYAYNDVAFRMRTLWSERGTIYELRGLKTDTFTTPDATRVGNWAAVYGVGSVAVMDANVIASGSFFPEFGGIYTKMSSIAPTIDEQADHEPPSNLSYNAENYLAFVSRAAYHHVSGVGAGNGDYHLQASSPLLNMIPSGYAVLPYDLDGVARRNDGTGAAGAYEYASNPTVYTGTVTMTGISDMAVTGVRLVVNQVVMNAIGTLTVVGTMVARGVVTMVGTGTMVVRSATGRLWHRVVEYFWGEAPIRMFPPDKMGG